MKSPRKRPTTKNRGRRVRSIYEPFHDEIIRLVMRPRVLRYLNTVSAGELRSYGDVTNFLNNRLPSTMSVSTCRRLLSAIGVTVTPSTTISVNASGGGDQGPPPPPRSSVEGEGDLLFDNENPNQQPLPFSSGGRGPDLPPDIVLDPSKIPEPPIESLNAHALGG